jgi:hypothetical protein
MSCENAPLRYFMDHYNGTREARVHEILVKIKAISYTGKVEIHNDYQTVRFEARNGYLVQTKSICSIADIVDSFE